MTIAAEPRSGVVEAAPVERHAARRPIATKVLLGLVALSLLGVTFSYLYGRGKETTDNAQLEAHVASVAAHIPGHVKRVLVEDHQEVRVGDVLIELDDRDLSVRLGAAKADRDAAAAALAAAEAQLSVAEASSRSGLKVARGGLDQAAAVAGTVRAAIAMADADLAAATSKRSLVELELKRAQALHEKRAISDAELDAQRSAFDQARAAETLGRARLMSANASVANSDGTVTAARGKLLEAEAGPEKVQAASAQVALASARVSQANASVAQAELNLSYALVRAEVAGVVARRSVEPGQSVSPERPLMAIVSLADPWVVANFKEDQIRNIRPGQRARVQIDTYGNQEFNALVASVSPGTGSRFSLLPPDNASGNFTKVVQRVPVLLRLDPVPAISMRPGMSSHVTVFTDR